MKRRLIEIVRKNQDGLLIIFLVFTLIPLCVASFYNQPSTDDYGCTTVIQAKGFLETQKFYYLTWNGRYFATALASINPLVFHSYIGYKVLSILFVILFAIAIYWAAGIFFKGISRLSKWGFTSLMVFAYFLNLPEIAQGLFWMSGSFTYQTAATFTILFLGCIVKFLQSRKNFYFILSIVYSLAIIGSNEVSMLYTDIIVLLMLMGNYLLDKKVNYYLIALFCMVLLFSAILVLAPGNAIRGGYYPLGHQFLNSLKNTYDFGKGFLRGWIAGFLFLYLIVFFFFMSINSNNQPKLWIQPKPLYVLLFCLCIPFIGICTGFWSMGVTPPVRMVNVPYFYFLLGIVYFLYVLSGFIKQRLSITQYVVPIGLNEGLILIVVIMAITKSNNLKTAYDDIFSGRISRYSEQMEERRQVIKNFKGNICQVKPIIDVPKTLYFQDIATDTADWKNELFSRYYGKSCILIK